MRLAKRKVYLSAMKQATEVCMAPTVLWQKTGQERQPAQPGGAKLHDDESTWQNYLISLARAVFPAPQ
jgi:hypothetical protein